MAGSLSWLAGLLLLVTVFEYSEAGYRFGDADYERNFVEFYSIKRMLAICYGDGREDNWLTFTEDKYTKCAKAMSGMEGSRALALPAISARSSKRKPFFDKIKLEELTDEIDHNVKEIMCVFDEIGLKINSQGRVDPSALHAYLKKFYVRWQVKNELTAEINECSRKSACGNYKNLGKDYIDFFKLVKFYKCFQDARLRSCIKYDLDTKKSDFDLHNLGSYLAGLSDSDKRMSVASAFYNDGDKMGGLWHFY